MEDERLNRALQTTYATKPTAWTRHFRVNILWQLWRFTVINVKMIRIIMKSH